MNQLNTLDDWRLLNAIEKGRRIQIVDYSNLCLLQLLNFTAQRYLMRGVANVKVEAGWADAQRTQDDILHVKFCKVISFQDVIQEHKVFRMTS